MSILQDKMDRTRQIQIESGTDLLKNKTNCFHSFFRSTPSVSHRRSPKAAKSMSRIRIRELFPLNFLLFWLFCVVLKVSKNSVDDVGKVQYARMKLSWILSDFGIDLLSLDFWLVSHQWFKIQSGWKEGVNFGYYALKFWFDTFLWIVQLSTF